MLINILTSKILKVKLSQKHKYVSYLLLKTAKRKINFTLKSVAQNNAKTNFFNHLIIIARYGSLDLGKLQGNMTKQSILPRMNPKGNRDRLSSINAAIFHTKIPLQYLEHLKQQSLSFLIFVKRFLQCTPGIFNLDQKFRR